MGFYVRKSLKAGPFRFNVSKSGVGVSAGVPGFRVGSGPRGNYVHVGRGGVYYRASLGSGHGRTQAATRSRPGQSWTPEMSANEQVVMEVITGATAVELAPTSADDLVNQLNAAASVLMWWKLFLLIPVVGWVAAYWLRLAQKARASVVVFYEVEDVQGRWFEQLVSAWGALAQSAGLWRMTSRGALTTTHQRKVNAGASSLINRTAAVVGSVGPRVLVTNIAVPSVAAGRESLHFLPDRVLVRSGKRFSEVSYAQLNVHCAQTRYIEDGRVPRDATQVGTTWKYANVRGGPDRRYNNNRQLPILGYAALEFGTPSGLQWTLQCSNMAAARTAASVLSKAKAPELAEGPPPLPAEQLISDVERDRAGESLQAAYLDGRLTEPEFEERSGAALQARRQSELDAALEGIPARPVAPPRGVSALPGASRPPLPSRPAPRMGLAHLAASNRTLKHPTMLWFSALPFGLGCWAPLYAGMRIRHRTVLYLGLAATASFIGGLIALSAAGSRSNNATAGIGTVLWLFALGSSIAAALVARSNAKRLPSEHREESIAAESRVSTLGPQFAAQTRDSSRPLAATSSTERQETQSPPIRRAPAGAQADPPPPPKAVPATRAAQSELLKTRPVAWEYYLFASELIVGMAGLESAWREHEERATSGPRHYLSADEAPSLLSDIFGELGQVVGRTDRVFASETQERAFGRPGEPGNPERIRELAQSAVAIYAELLRLSALVRSQLASRQFAESYELAAQIIDQPICQMRDFFNQMIQSIGQIGQRLAHKENDGPITVEMTLLLSMDEDLLARFQATLASA